jgi:hypothetical protein
MVPIFIATIICIFNMCGAISEEPRNNVIFERVDTDIFDHTRVSYLNIEMRPISPNVLKANFTLILRRQFITEWSHIVMYYKSSSNVYRKHLVDVWEDLCGYWNGNALAPVTRYFLENMKNLKMRINFPFRCPLDGSMSITHPQFNASNLVIPLLSAGRYRIDIFMVTHKGGNPVLVIKFFFAVSDHRIWF